MSSSSVDFENILELFEKNGWKLGKMWGQYRVFVRPGKLPWLIPVNNKKVDIEYVEKINEFFGQEDHTA